MITLPNGETHEVVSESDWVTKRKELLAEEKRLMKEVDALKARARALPWVKVEKEYSFEGPEGRLSLADLFGNRNQLFVKHFMLAPGDAEPCVGCSLESDHVDGLLPHLESHDVSYVAIARAPIAEIEAVRARMGWRFRWVSSHGSDFNYDFGASFLPEDRKAGTAVYNWDKGDPGLDDLSGNSVFFKDEKGDIYYTYATFGRGGEQFLGIYSIFDLVPKGREEYGPNHSLTDWVKHHDAYGAGTNGRSSKSCH